MTSIASVRGPQDCQAPGPHPPCHLGSHEAHPPSHLDPQLPAAPSAPCRTLSSLPDPQLPAAPTCCGQTQSSTSLLLHPGSQSFWEGLPTLHTWVSLPGAPSSLLAKWEPPTLSKPPPSLSLEESEEPRWPRGSLSPAPPTRLCAAGLSLSPRKEALRPPRPWCGLLALFWSLCPWRTSYTISGKVALGSW